MAHELLLKLVKRLLFLGIEIEQFIKLDQSRQVRQFRLSNRNIHFFMTKNQKTLMMYLNFQFKYTLGVLVHDLVNHIILESQVSIVIDGLPHRPEGI